MTKAMPSYQDRVNRWIIACFGEKIARDRVERNHRFIEEALETVQANGCTREEAHAFVDYVFDRPAGVLEQEIGGVMNTLATLCSASGIEMMKAADIELARMWTEITAIRAKRAAKPLLSPLPEAVIRDPIVEAVRADLLKRSQLGVAKYGVTLARDDLSFRAWIQHLYEELLDASNYAKRTLTALESAEASGQKHIHREGV